MSLTTLKTLSRTYKGVAKIQAEKGRLLQKVAEAKAVDNGKKLIRCQKAAYYSPFVQYEAYKAAVRRHSTFLFSAADFLDKADSLIHGALSMDWNQEWTYPRPVLDLPKPDGTIRQISTTGSLEDTAREILIRWILEAEWQGQLDPCSYGAKGGGMQQALKAVANYVFGHPMFYLKLDIRACFDTVNHDYLFARLKKELTTFCFDRLQPFLVAEFTDGQTIWDVETGIAQGSSLSAVALEVTLKDLGEYVTQGFTREELFLARYVDDLLLMSPDAEILQVAKSRLEDYLANTGLTFNDKKTLSGTTITDNQQADGYRRPGFVFLGWRVSQYLSPNLEEYETWLELEIPEGRLWKKRREEKNRGRKGNYANCIKQQVASTSKAIDGKAWVQSFLHYNSGIPIEPLEDWETLV